MEHHIISANNIKLHYLEYPSPNKPKLILLHGITANAHAFGGLVKRGLDKHFHLYSPDLRGRGLSDKPAFGYSMEEHAQDILGLLDHLKIEKAVLCGHSYGGLLGVYLATHYPERVASIMLLDAAQEMNPNAAKMLIPTFSRLGVLYPTYDIYIRMMKKAPQNIIWEDAMEAYYQADVTIDKLGVTQTNSNISNVTAMAVGLTSLPWESMFEHIQQPAILMHALDNYTLDEPLLPLKQAKKAVKLIDDCQYVTIEGNHQTMLYGKGAEQVVANIISFYKQLEEKLKKPEMAS